MQDREDTLRWVKFSGFSWTHDNAGFFYSRFPEPAEGAHEVQHRADVLQRIGAGPVEWDCCERHSHRLERSANVSVFLRRHCQHGMTIRSHRSEHLAPKR